MLFELSRDSLYFPSPELALTEPNGLLAVGGDLSSQRLIKAYQQGIFPWYGEQDPILWWSPNPRAVISATSLHVSRSMQRFIKKLPFQVTLNHAFEQVMQTSAQIHRSRGNGVWIHRDMIQAYTLLHQQKRAHSVEVWLDEQLVGGLYGVATHAVFSAESMFHTHTNASKVALLLFAQQFFQAGGTFIDAQVINSHTQSLGAFEMPRRAYLQHLQQTSTLSVDNFWSPRLLKL